MSIHFFTRRVSVLATIIALAAALAPPTAHAQTADVLSRESVLRDPDIPPLGNPKGDVTIVEFFDYQCPACRTFAPELARVLAEDGNIRLVLKDWPVFGPVSEYAARLVLAAKYQGKFREAHMSVIGARRALSEAGVRGLLAEGGVDVARAQRDLAANKKSIDALLVRNNAQAEAFGFNGTPSFIVGTFRVPGVPTPEALRQMIIDARAAAKRPN